MSPSITARALFEGVEQRLDLRWAGGSGGDQRLIEAGESLSRRPSLAGYLNLIHPNKVQILGREELAWLDNLDPRQRWEAIARITSHKSVALIVSRGQKPPGDLLEACEEMQTPLWASNRPGHEILTYLQYHLARALARRMTLHGVFMEVYSIGVLITGESGAGKSELALELITRGHRLIADDAPEFTQIAPDVIDGTCPEMLQDCLEVRGLGILNVREMFGDTSVKRNKYLRLIVHLAPAERHQPDDGLKRLYGDQSAREVFDVKIPQLTVPVAPGRNLAVLVEAAVRNQILRSKGIDPAQVFIDRQAHQMRKSSPWNP